MARFTKVSEDAFDALQTNAGVLLSTFDPENPTEPASEDIIATTSGGISTKCVAEYQDFAEDVDNVPNKMMEFNLLKGWDCSMSFTAIKFNAEGTVWALGAADTEDGQGYKKIVPRADVKLSDYKDIWWVGDKANGGAYAVRLMNALSTGGMDIKTAKNEKGKNTMTISGFVSLKNQDLVPMEFYDFEPFDDGSNPTPTPTPAPTYSAVTPDGTENPSELGWYEFDGTDYVLTTDTTVDDTKTYYTQD